MFWIFVLACGGAGDVPEGAPGDATSIFDQEVAPASLSAPVVLPPRPPASAESEPAPEPSQKCKKARARFDVAEARIIKMRNLRVTPVADRVDEATVLLSRCIRDVDWCGTRAAGYKQALRAAEGEFDRVLGQVTVEEVKLFPLNQAVDTACRWR